MSPTRHCLYLFLSICASSLAINISLILWRYETRNGDQSDRDVGACAPPTLGGDIRMSDSAAAVRVRAIFQESSQFIREVQRIGRAMAAAAEGNETNWSCKRRRRVVSVRMPGYFEAADSLRHVRTVTFRTAKCRLAPYLVGAYYDYSSNNCTDLLRHAHPGSHRVYAAVCRDDIDETMEGVPLQDKDLSVGLPRSVHVDPSAVIWAYVHVVRNAVVDEKGNVMTEDGRLEPYQCYRRWQPRCDDDQLNGTAFHAEVFTIKSHWSTYYHTTIEQLARLPLYKNFLASNPQIVLHHSAPHPFQDVLGLADRRTVTGSVRAGVVYSPGANPCGVAGLFQTQLLSAVLRSAEPRRRRRNCVVLIRRSAKRFFKHHDDILNMLRNHSSAAGLDVNVFADDPLPSAERTRAIFYDAIIIVAPHGAGEANIVLSAPGTVLIEGLCKDGRTMLSLCYQHTARVLGMHYHGIVPRTQCMDITAADIEKPFLKFLHLYLQGRLVSQAKRTNKQQQQQQHTITRNNRNVA